MAVRYLFVTVILLLQTATEEREEFLLKQCEIHNALESFDQEYKDMQEKVISLNDKCKHLEDKKQGTVSLLILRLIILP